MESCLNLFFEVVGFPWEWAANHSWALTRCSLSFVSFPSWFPLFHAFPNLPAGCWDSFDRCESCPERVQQIKSLLVCTCACWCFRFFVGYVHVRISAHIVLLVCVVLEMSQVCLGSQGLLICCMKPWVPWLAGTIFVKRLHYGCISWSPHFLKLFCSCHLELSINYFLSGGFAMFIDYSWIKVLHDSAESFMGLHNLFVWNCSKFHSRFGWKFSFIGNGFSFIYSLEC